MKVDKPINWSGRTIVVVEDDIYNYLYLKAVLVNTRANIIHAKNGEEAVEICKRMIRIDVILMDIIMPKMNGIAAAKLINEFRNDIPIIAQSAVVPTQYVEQIRNKEFAACIFKPFKPSELINIILEQFSCASKCN